MANFGIAMVGAGMAALPHVRALQELADRVSVRGVFTRDAGRRTEFATKHGFPVADSLEALAADPSVNALLLLTPPNVRLEPIRLFAAAGKHVLCEKPLGRTLAEAEACQAMCDAAGVRLGVVFQHRFREATRRLAGILAAGRLGRIEMVRAEVPWWRGQEYYDTPGRGTMAQDGGGVLMTQAIHTLDVMLSLAGPVAEVQALAATTGLHRMECEDFVAAGLRFASGAVGSVMATTAAFPGGADCLRLDGTHGSAELRAGALSIRWRDGTEESFGTAAGAGGSADPMAFKHHWHRDLIAAFAGAVTRGETPVPSGRDALAAQRLIDAMIRSSADRSAVRVKD